MKYLPKNKDMQDIANLFCDKYNYVIYEQSLIDGMGYSSITLKNETLPTIKIEMERYIVDVQLELDNYISLILIHKYLFPKEILRSNKAYKKRKIFLSYFGYDNLKYFEQYMKNKDLFSINEFHNFFRKYPVYVWKWNE